MAVVPKTKAGKVAWFKSRLSLWEANSVAMGSSASEITAFAALVSAAEAAVNEQTESETAFRGKVEAADEAVAAMDVAGATIISEVRTKARTAGPVVYQLSGIPVPLTPSPKGDPGTPEALKVELDGNGGLILTWRCSNPPGAQGTFYQVFRNDTGNAAGPFTSLGVAGGKKFIDESVPMGATAIVYKIRAIRTTAGGMWATFNVVFGSNAGGGTMVTAVADTTAPKLAA
jgi:hypothetical protein